MGAPYIDDISHLRVNTDIWYMSLWKQRERTDDEHSGARNV
jgi:hypothetical protein